MAFEHFNTKPPEDLVPPADNQEAPPADAPASGTPEAQGTPPAEPPKAQETKPDEFIENFNKRYATQYKSDDEIKNLFSLTGKVSEYEGKLKDHDTLKTDVDKYKKELDETKTRMADATNEFLNRPLIRKAYVAEQLQAKYPDRDPDILGAIAMSDVDKMSDIEAIAKEKMISVKGLTLDEAKLAKLADFGIDVTTPPEEWDSVAKARVKIAGAEARERMKQLLQGIELPKVTSKEEREALQVKALEDKVKATTPIREIFKKFDTFKVGESDFVVPDEFKSKLDDMFTGMFIDGGLDVNEQNIATAELLKKGLFLEEYFPKILEVHEGIVRAKVKEETDKLLHNDTPPNTATATDQTPTDDRPGLGKFFQDQREGRVTKL